MVKSAYDIESERRRRRKRWKKKKKKWKAAAAAAAAAKRTRKRRFPKLTPMQFKQKDICKLLRKDGYEIYGRGVNGVRSLGHNPTLPEISVYGKDGVTNYQHVFLSPPNDERREMARILENVAARIIWGHTKGIARIVSLIQS